MIRKVQKFLIDTLKVSFFITFMFQLTLVTAAPEKGRYKLICRYLAYLEGKDDIDWNETFQAEDEDGNTQTYGYLGYRIVPSSDENYLRAPGAWSGFKTAEEATKASEGKSTFIYLDGTQDIEYKYFYHTKEYVYYGDCDRPIYVGGKSYELIRANANINGYRLNGTLVREEYEEDPLELIAYVVYTCKNPDTGKEDPPPISKLVTLGVDRIDKKSGSAHFAVTGAKHQLWQLNSEGILEKVSSYGVVYFQDEPPESVPDPPKLADLQSHDAVYYVQPLEEGVITAKVTYKDGTLSDTDIVKIQVELCPSCANGNCTAGGTSTRRSGGAMTITFNIFSDKVSTYNGGIQITTGKAPSQNLATPESIEVNIRPEEGNEVITDENDTVTQVKTDTMLMDVEVIDDYKYQQIYYTADNVGEKDEDGEYTVTGDPYRVVTIEDMDKTGVTEDLKITNTTTIDGATSTTVDEIKWNDDNTSWDNVSGNGEKTESYIEGEYDSNNCRDDYSIIKDKNGNIIYKEKICYKRYDWNESVTEEVIDPDGKAITTSYTYYDDATTDGVKLGLLKSVTYHDGSWVRYEYDDYGRQTKAISPFNNSLITDAESLCRVSETTYDETNNVTGYIEKVLGVEVSRSYEQDIDQFESKSIQCTVAGAAYDAASNLVTVTKLVSLGSFAGKTKSVSYPDGRMTIYEYDDDGDTATTTVYSGVPDAGGSEIIEGTKTLTRVNIFGTTIYSKTFDIESGLVTSMYTPAETDVFGRAIRVTNMDGTETTTVYGCCGPSQVTNKEGTVTTYAYDDQQRLSYTTTDGISTFYTYDAMGRTVKVTVKGSDGTEITQSETTYDLAGDVTAEKDALGRTTSYSEATVDGVFTRTTTNPDGTTVVSKYNKEGSTSEVSGTSTHTVKYEYGVESGELYTKVITVGDGGSETQWVKSFTNFMGQTYKTVYPDSSTEMTYFDSYGRPIKQVGPTGITTLTTYNDLGEVEVQALDVNRNGVIDYNGTDRITKYANSYTLQNNLTFQQSIVYSYLTDNSSTATPVSISLSAVTGLGSSSAYFGRTSTFTTSYPGNGQRVTVSTNPDGTTVTNTYQDGRLTSSVHSVLGTTSYTYDEFGRMKTVSQTIGGIAQATTYSYNSLGQVTSITDPASRETSYLYDIMGRRTKAYLPGGAIVNYEYYDTGELKTQYGTDTYSQRYAYDAAGRMKTLTTYKNWSNSGPSSGAESTTWSYDSQRGFMTSKTYADSKSVGYSYYADGSLNVRTWARGTTTTYSYNGAGALAGVDYSDSTPDISYTYNRLGYPTSVTDGAGVWTMAYYPDGSLATCIAPHIVDSVAYIYDSLGRRTSMNLMNGTTPVRTTTYGYDSGSRLLTVYDGANTATYSRVSGSNLLSSTVINNGSSDILTTTRTYDSLNRLTSISSSAGGKTYSYAYTYNDRDKRTKCTLADGSYWVYEYDDLGQVTKGKKYTSTGYAIPGQSFGYEFDTIGNLITENRNGNIYDYTSNSVNQYTQRTVPGRVNVSGSADIDAKVTIKHGTDYDRADRFGEYFNKFYTLDNSSSSVSDTFDIYAVKFDTTNSRDDVAMQSLNVFIPQTPEQFTYDDDGNMLTDGQYTYTWNGENRLISVVETGVKKLVFKYDFMGRRTNKEVYAWNSGTSSWDLSYERKFVYDNWKLIAEYDGSNNLLYSYIWNGALLFVNDGTNSYSPVYDGNKNIMTYIRTSDGSNVADYRYDTFAREIWKNGSQSTNMNYRYSSEYYDKETGMYYYGKRYLRPEIRRWLNQDPIGTDGGLNTYAFVGNNPVNYVDKLGLALYAFDGTNNVPSDNTNITLMKNAYTGNKAYIRGIGNSDEYTAVNRWYRIITGRGLDSKSSEAIEKLKENFDRGDRTVDIIGFSRGAVTAVLFAQTIAKAKKKKIPKVGCIEEIRFMGLYDPVPGPFLSINKKIPRIVKKTAIAYSLDEKRGVFEPALYSGSGIARAAFRGGHMDVGGGYLQRGLANISLQWMLSQAQSAGATEFSMPSTPGTDALIRHQETGYKYFGYYKDRGGMAPNHTSVGSLRYYEVIKEAYSMWGGIDLSEKRYYYTYGGGTGLSSFYSTRDNGLK